VTLREGCEWDDPACQIFLDCVETPESTRQVCAAGKQSYNWTKGQNKGREAPSLSVLKLRGLGRSKITGGHDQ
jgi:hypothetical protein